MNRLDIIYVALDGKGFSVFRCVGRDVKRLAGPFAASALAHQEAAKQAIAAYRNPTPDHMTDDVALWLCKTGHVLTPIRRDVWREQC